MERNYTVHHFSRRLRIHHSSERSRSGSRSGGHLAFAWREAKFLPWRWLWLFRNSLFRGRRA